MPRHLTAFCLAVVVFGCNDKKEPPQAASTSATPLTGASPSARPASSFSPFKPFPIPTGPVLSILRGEGLGPIRFGATVATIERLMGVPCTERTETLCRYPGHAIEFVINPSGVTDQMRIYGLRRRAADGKVYGMFNGRFPSGAQFGMLREAIVELEGKPERIETVQGENPTNTVEIYHYENMQAAFDRIANGNVVLGQVTLFSPKKGKPTK
jgi:hypothetical protein